MGNISIGLWKEAKSNSFTNLANKIRGRKNFVLSGKPEYSACLKSPITVAGIVLAAENLSVITVYCNGEKKEECLGVPEHSIDYMLNLIGEKTVNGNA